MWRQERTHFDSLLDEAIFAMFDEVESENIRNAHGGSKKGKRANLTRDFDGAAKQFHDMYFSEEPLFDEVAHFAVVSPCR